MRQGVMDWRGCSEVEQIPGKRIESRFDERG
jgi:hypothetical protein